MTEPTKTRLAGPLSLEGLLSIIARAARQPLAPHDAAQLRNALHLGDAARHSSGGLQHELRRARQNLQLAEDELQERRRPPTSPHRGEPLTPMEVACPACGAMPKNRCHNAYSTTRTHQTRHTAAREASS